MCRVHGPEAGCRIAVDEIADGCFFPVEEAGAGPAPFWRARVIMFRESDRKSVV